MKRNKKNRTTDFVGAIDGLGHVLQCAASRLERQTKRVNKLLLSSSSTVDSTDLQCADGGAIAGDVRRKLGDVAARCACQR